MSITFSPNMPQEVEMMNCLDVYPALAATHFKDDTAVEWRDGLPYLPFVVSPEARYTNSAALQIMKLFGWDVDYCGSASVKQVKEAMNSITFVCGVIRHQDQLQAVFAACVENNVGVVWG